MVFWSVERLRVLQDSGATAAVQAAETTEAAALSVELSQITADGAVNRDLVATRQEWSAKTDQTINRLNEISTAIASAVEEQGAAMQEISRNVQEASSGTAEVTNNISGMTQASQQTSAGSTQVLGAASELARNGEKLRQEVEQFLATVRAA